MTGGQPNPGLPVDGVGDEAPAINIEKLVEAIGVKFIRTTNPHSIRKTIDIYKEALEYEGVSVVITQFPCTLIKGIKKRKPMSIQDNCTKCYKCVDELACPAISKIGDDVVIDSNMCFGCVACAQICPEKAIKAKKEDGE
jgi:indolepyruvate ferredoxin oxidoreductase alpha subunit